MNFFENKNKKIKNVKFNQIIIKFKLKFKIKDNYLYN